MPGGAMAGVNNVFGSEAGVTGIEQRLAGSKIELRIGHHLIDVGLRDALLGIIDPRGYPPPFGINDMGYHTTPADQDVGLGPEQPAFTDLRAEAEQASTCSETVSPVRRTVWPVQCHRPLGARDALLFQGVGSLDEVKPFQRAA